MARVVSWNVNGIRAVERKGVLEDAFRLEPDVLCLQETKAQPEQVSDALKCVAGYESYWCSAERPGYSGVAAYARRPPKSITGLGLSEFDSEGRAQFLEFEGFTVVNAYFPNSQDQGARLDYKLAFCDALLARCQELRGRGVNLVICGDYNIAHKPIDLKNPKSNEKNPGYLPEERAWMDKFVDSGYVDTFRMFCDEPEHYSWWSYRFKAREKNVGWRIDYHCVNAEFRDQVRAGEIRAEIMGSDHCPVLVDLDAGI
jgi:exodeoxyribonuclease-3